MSGKAVRETLGFIGVIASMVFVGLEIRQNAEATRAATVLQLKDGWAELNLTMMQNPEMADALQLVLAEGFEDVDPQSQLIVGAWWRTLMHNWSNAYFQYRIGTLDDEQWQALIREMEYESSGPIVWAVWDRNRYIFDDSFRTLMDSLRAANFPASP